MPRTLLPATAGAIVLVCLTTPCRAEWFNYLVRTSGLGWSDGYHAYDQCPPKHHGHWGGHHAFAAPAWGMGEQRAEPYYFEEPTHKAAPPVEQLPSAPVNGNSRAPDPQARHQAHSPYFQALRAEQRGGVTATSPTLQAQRPANRPPF